jgi:hypothetical protein
LPVARKKPEPSVVIRLLRSGLLGLEIGEDMFKTALSRVAIALLVMAAAPFAWAQSAGSLRGTVSDKTGAGCHRGAHERIHQVHP